ncbi:Nitroimidazol reductase NimA, pyridoxamine 5'-phosphate oxidase superfamily [Dietzia kunjamensis subsp. schimae]|uniref:Pyridoxamine 5'-phosphate oxidase family protein n=2 Tax=Dietzia TaxID=37914 RepID=A0AAE4QYV2_9ACTN|nr:MULTISPECIES: pyridoxamine 5'-phosphate oxidase family protein [Dietzia]ODQ83828.1 pyridoxamine 5-phosphate oxidase [Dietzia alimentaria]MBB1015326.1 pyridoxamine 5'-phosphate oxidase family protein [Dietzia kunjamensis subsp. schimae]MDJ0423807.1 pyridoxamine 5'-phosphate oxidase family protein [Dietzia kunjamensis]MDN4507394.1 pyridoxamine 5'-phosphate oxidase family protein [Dietzia maris]MDV6300550.1 pyridoxamine 5'-phosphate oxidase family protein [Dietzia maris]
MDANPITEFDEARSLQLLGTVSLGRLVTVSEGRADIFPVNYALSPEGKLFFRTAEGSKLAGITVHPDVVFQVDHIEGDDAWSIVVRGTARRLDSFAEINRAEELGLKPWIPTLKYNFVEITPEKISGRGFTFGEEPERYTGY